MGRLPIEFHPNASADAGLLHRRHTMSQYRLSTLFIAVFLICGNLAVAGWDSEYGIATTATTLAIVAIVVARQTNRSRFVSAFLGIITATIGAALYGSGISSFYAFTPPPIGATWMFGGGWNMIIMAGVFGGFAGLMYGGLPVAVGYGLVHLLRFVLFEQHIQCDVKSD